MKLIKLEQSSPEWLQWREGGIGGSEIATVVGLNPYETKEELFYIKTGQRPPKDLSNNPHVQRGKLLEDKARELVCDRLNKEFVPDCFEMHNFNFCKYSSDGHDDPIKPDEIIEIKCPGKKNHEKIKELQGPLPYYLPQCQYGMMITGASVCWFVSYNQSFPEPLEIFPVYADKKYQAWLLYEAANFWHAVLETKLALAKNSNHQVV